MDLLAGQNGEEPPDAKSQPTTDHVAAQEYSAAVAIYRERVFRFLFRRFRNPDDAGDLTQEAFKQAWKHWHKIRATADLWPWLCETANNLAIDLLRRRTNPTRNTKSLDSPNIVDSTPGPLVEITRAEMNSIVRATVDELSDEDGVLIRGYYFEEMSIDQLAVHIGKSWAATNSALHRARRRLESKLKRIHAIADAMNLSASNTGGST